MHRVAFLSKASRPSLGKSRRAAGIAGWAAHCCCCCCCCCHLGGALCLEVVDATHLLLRYRAVCVRESESERERETETERERQRGREGGREIT